MGEVVAAIFLLMFIFGLLTFSVVLLASFFLARLDEKIALALLGFAGSGATGFAATWRFTVLAREREPGRTADDEFAVGRSGEERDFFDRHGYWPMSGESGRTGRWEP